MSHPLKKPNYACEALLTTNLVSQGVFVVFVLLGPAVLGFGPDSERDAAETGDPAQAAL